MVYSKKVGNQMQGKNSVNPVKKSVQSPTAPLESSSLGYILYKFLYQVALFRLFFVLFVDDQVKQITDI